MYVGVSLLAHTCVCLCASVCECVGARDHGHDAVIDLSKSGLRQKNGLVEGHRAAFFARKDFEIFIKSSALRQCTGDILTALDVKQLQ